MGFATFKLMDIDGFSTFALTGRDGVLFLSKNTIKNRKKFASNNAIKSREGFVTLPNNNKFTRMGCKPIPTC
jgi:hypothetical protein